MKSILSNSCCVVLPVVVEKKKRVNKKRKLSDDASGDENDDEDSISPLSYTYTNCDSSEILQEMEQQQQLQESMVMYQSHSTIHADDDFDEDDSTLGEHRQPPVFRWLTWRMDPIKSFSDWTINVYILLRTNRTNPSPPQPPSLSHNDVVMDDNDENDNVMTVTQQQRYHVHKNILVVESQFFQTILHQLPSPPPTTTTSTTATMVTATAASSTTDITLLNEYEALVFPTFLDYMYSPGSVWINSHNASTMFLLAKYFGMKRLQWLCRQYLKMDESRKQQQQQLLLLPNQACASAATSPNVSSFQQRMNNLSRMVQSNENALLNNPAEVANTTTVIVKDSPIRRADTSTPMQQRIPVTDATVMRQVKLSAKPTTNHHNHISTNSSTTTTTATAVSEHVTTTTTATKPSKSNEGYY